MPIKKSSYSKKDEKETINDTIYIPSEYELINLHHRISLQHLYTTATLRYINLEIPIKHNTIEQLKYIAYIIHSRRNDTKSTTPYCCFPKNIFNQYSLDSNKIIKTTISPSLKLALHNIKNWDFDIFTFNTLCYNRPLAIILVFIVFKHRLIDILNIDKKTFLSFALSIEDGYNNNPYHNSLHATDILQCVYMMCTSQTFLRKSFQDDINIKSPSSLSMTSSLSTKLLLSTEIKSEYEKSSNLYIDLNEIAKLALSNEYSIDNDDENENETKTTLIYLLKPQDLQCLFISAACHDIGHPGINNEFLKLINHDICKIYSNTYLEIFHMLLTKFLLNTNKLFNNNLSLSLQHEFIDTISSMIISTDMIYHDQLLNDFNIFIDILFKIPFTDTIYFIQKNRILIMKILIHAADISNPARSFILCKRWSKKLIQELLSMQYLTNIIKKIDFTANVTATAATTATTVATTANNNNDKKKNNNNNNGKNNIVNKTLPSDELLKLPPKSYIYCDIEKHKHINDCRFLLSNNNIIIDNNTVNTPWNLLLKLLNDNKTLPSTSDLIIKKIINISWDYNFDTIMKPDDILTQYRFNRMFVTPLYNSIQIFIPALGTIACKNLNTNATIWNSIYKDRKQCPTPSDSEKDFSNFL